jgi:hypothetical protein
VKLVHDPYTKALLDLQARSHTRERERHERTEARIPNRMLS